MLDDALFLPTPKGMVPTERARNLAPAIRDIVCRAGAIIGSPAEFDARTAARGFRIGAPDGAVSVIVPSLIRRLRSEAPNIDLRLIHLLPRPSLSEAENPCDDALAELDSHRIDLAILPHEPAQQRFHCEPIYSEDFVIVARKGHGKTGKMSIKAFADADHVLVSAAGDRSGFVDKLLAERGYGRRIALTVPSFFMAAAAITSSDLIGALPRHFAAQAAQAFPLEIIEPPFVMGKAHLNAIVPQAALLDAGVAWLFATIKSVPPMC
jgi:DNA-binding transcriptional LysR family regulator